MLTACQALQRLSAPGDIKKHRVQPSPVSAPNPGKEAFWAALENPHISDVRTDW